jgi:hypothetical protein
MNESESFDSLFYFCEISSRAYGIIRCVAHFGTQSLIVNHDSARKIIEMKIILSPILLFLFISFSSCNKDEATVSVLMRVENTTSQNFTQVLSNGESFGRVNASFTTSYKSFEKIVDVPAQPLLQAVTRFVQVFIILIFPPTFIQENIHCKF